MNIQESSRLMIPNYVKDLEDYQDLRAFYPIFSKETKKYDEDEENLDNSLTLDNSIGEASRKSTDISFKAKFKTEKCKLWDFNKNCKYGDNCAFAHGSNEMRQKTVSTSFYKTKKCKQFFEFGYCPYGSRCQFMHKNDQNFPKSYKDLLNSLANKGDLKNDPLKRLKVFENFSLDEKQKKKILEIKIYKENFISNQYNERV